MISKVHKNGKVKRGSKVANSLPLNSPLDGIFGFGGPGCVAPASQPWEMANNASYNLLSLQRILLSYTYVIQGPIRTLVDQPVYDAFRGGLKIKTEEVSPEELEDFHKELKRLKLQNKIIDALRWDRLFGGAGIIVNTNQDFSQPFNIKEVNEKSPLEFIVADRWQLAWNGTPGSTKASFTYSPGGYGIDAEVLAGKKIHQTRVAKIIGEEAPSLVRQRLQGWGMSCIECVIRELNMYFKNNNVIFELLDEAKVDIWKIKGFNSQILSQAAAGKTAKRIQMATQMKNFLNAITLDAEDDYEQKTQTFTGLADMLEQIRIGIAAAIRMPMAKIFGLASKGFASGEDDIENYNAIVEGQREKAEDVLDVLIPVVCMKVFGFVPDDLAYEWKPLRVLSAEQEQNVLNAKFERLSSLYSQGILNPQEYAQALKDEDILTMETEVSKGQEPEPPMAAGQEQELEIASEASAKKPSGGKSATKAKE